MIHLCLYYTMMSNDYLLQFIIEIILVVLVQKFSTLVGSRCLTALLNPSMVYSSVES